MPNRHERRAAESLERKSDRQDFDKVVIRLDESSRESLKKMVNRDYVRGVESLGAALARWKAEHPDEKLEWHDTKRTLLGGMPLDSAECRGYLAANAAADRCVVWADEATGGKMTILQLQFAIGLLGWDRPEGSG